MPAEIVNFEAQLPEVVYLDSNIVINLCNENAKYYNPCRNFVRCTRDEGVMVVVSTLTLDEVWYGLLRIKLIDEYGDKEWLNVIREDPSVIKPHIPYLKRITRDISLISNILLIEIRAESTLASLELMETYSLFPRDAIHLSVMFSIGIRSVATTDLDFVLVDGINVYTCNPKAFEDK